MVLRFTRIAPSNAWVILWYKNDASIGYFFHEKAKWRPSFDFCHINNHYNKIPNLNVSMIWETFESDSWKRGTKHQPTRQDKPAQIYESLNRIYGMFHRLKVECLWTYSLRASFSFFLFTLPNGPLESTKTTECVDINIF